VYDLARAACLAAATPGKPLYISDEYDKRTVALDVNNAGYVSNLRLFAGKGEFSAVPDSEGNVYVADGEIYIFNSAGKQTGLIRTPERPVTLTPEGKEIYFTGSHSLYRVSLPAIKSR
jgi:sugar lactone lactonase YvrE